jgi:8-oxo-dGTP pyrophosphatase MutT (NUDIX family)
MQVAMDFEPLIQKLRQRLTEPLPGASAHDIMRAIPVGPLRPRFEHSLPPKPGSVLILLYPERDAIKFPLTLRADYLGAHSGQVSFPGGKAEPGETYLETALRECEEEVGVKQDTVEILGRLSDFFVIPSNFLVTPVVGMVRSRPHFKADPVEVVKIIEGNLFDLVREDAIRQKEILAAKQYRMMAPYFEFDGEIVWGATAMMLNELRMILREIKGL